jgi:hypothetical protein
MLYRGSQEKGEQGGRFPRAWAGPQEAPLLRRSPTDLCSGYRGPGPASHLLRLSPAFGRPVSWGPGLSWQQQMSVLWCHQELARARDQLEASTGSVGDRWLRQLWLLEIVQDMRHLAGLSGLASRGGLELLGLEQRGVKAPLFPAWPCTTCPRGLWDLLEDFET